ncbi:hypothetical protein PPSIR1_19974 [Plesiocystis pacifica SIR-1]|uniref:TfoX N-terminal domain-containing protein n=1 Tax=Plesiocystis pacifica SIR-1 TaxID=391625 RepID=A6GDU7_9BACT|nr:TfoX/Sxy family protein [Plesiocystis pacifica]EDM75986.1 hypothetical protein PPSIR1_19974 [Plesiocystis pacifica SIR-1]
MAYDEGLADRVRDLLATTPGYAEKKMFGGLCFLIHGNMTAGVVKDELMLRVGEARFEKVLGRKHARPMDFTGRPMKGMVYVGVEGLKTKRQLESWLKPARAFAEELPPKVAKKKKRAAKKKATKRR